MVTAYDVINLFYIGGILLFLYSSKKNSLTISLLELFSALSFAFGFETFNIEHGHYTYPYSYFYFGKVPLSILIAWYVVFMLGKYWIQLILYFYLLKRPKNETNYHFIPLIIILTGLISTTFAFVFDPIASRLQWWEWNEANPFLGVPIGEFYGIFISVFIISVIFWTLYLLITNYYLKERVLIIPKTFNKYDLLPFIIYEILVLVLTSWSFLTSINDNDVLNGVVVAVIATQIIVFIWLLLLIDNLDELNQNNSSIMKMNIILIILIVIGIISLIYSILSILSFNLPFLERPRSMFMILFSFGLICSGFAISLFLKMKSILH